MTRMNGLLLIAFGSWAAATSATAFAAGPNLCEEIKPADVESVIKEKVTSSEPLKYTRGCTYRTAKPGAKVTINFLNTGGDAKGEFEGQKKIQGLSGKVQAIDGLGDEAVIGVVLIVRRGERVLMIEPEALPDAERRDQAIALARIALEKGS